MLGPLIAICVAVLIIAFAIKLIRIEGDERGDGDDPWNWRGWGGPDDWPELPPAPKGSGPSLDYVPDEWVFEELGPPPKLIFPKVKEPDQPSSS